MESLDWNQTDSYVSNTVDFSDRIIGIFGVILAIWITVSNVTFIISILRDGVRRRNLFWLLIINLAVADVLVGVGVVPYAALYYYKGFWIFGERFCHVWVTSDWMLGIVSIVTLVVISSERLVNIKHGSRTTTGTTKCGIVCLLMALPWAIGAAISIFLTVVINEVEKYQDQCYFIVEPPQKILSPVISFFIPIFVCIGVDIGILMKWRELRQEQGEYPRKQTVGVLLVCTAYILMRAPFYVIFPLSAMGVYAPLKAVSISNWLAYANSGVNPLLWLVSPKVREGYWALLCCRGRGQ
ncbi:beta-1 adrenergic receptor-like [Haliotis rubra]|uniref:beta-1 adrenergic receptor-like n=1 Tax=Haliotis rubra TaxID=36100 RepID=UPI001EE563D2|nr:beta-1 adrenergic receptor-like [Haliotis rubra]